VVINHYGPTRNSGRLANPNPNWETRDAVYALTDKLADHGELNAVLWHVYEE